MAEFINPFAGLTPGRKLTGRELTRALRMALSAEEEAVHLYESLADATDQELARSVLQDIANEERVHVGEFQRLLSILLEDEAGWLAEGAGEVDALRKNIQPLNPVADAAAAGQTTIGSLKGG